MIDEMTKERLLVRNEGSVGPYIKLPEIQLEEVRQILDRHSLYYWVEENRISYDGGPFIALIDFGRKGDADAIQRILDDEQ